LIPQQLAASPLYPLSYPANRILRRGKNFSVAFLLENIRYNSSIRKIKKKSPVNMRKETSIIEIKQNLCQKSVITIKIEKQEFCPGNVSERGEERIQPHLHASKNLYFQVNISFIEHS
jgi:hypothetical protein